MTNSKRRLVLAIVLVITIILSGLFFLPIVFSISNQLSKTDRVNANILVVEGWLPPNAIEMAYKEFKNNGYSYILTTGLKSPEYYNISMNGYLIFYPQRKISKDNGRFMHEIEINALSELGGENAAQFNIFVNKVQVANFVAEKKKRKYTVNWTGKLTDIDSVMIQFTNDAVSTYGDRNLYVKEIIIDNKITIPYQNNSEYDISGWNYMRRIVNNFNSNAQLARTRLISLGVDSSLVKAIPGIRVKINRTLSSALAFREWLKTSGMEVKGINIVTIGTHAMRTRMTYNKIMDGKYNIGIIALPDFTDSYGKRYIVKKTLRESLGIIYYWIILLPY